MSDATRSIQAHYGSEQLVETILNALKDAGHDTDNPTVDMFSLVDQLHGGGLNATKAQAELAGVTQGMKVLDSGCGVGGASRYLANSFGCQVEAMDLLDELAYDPRIKLDMDFRPGDIQLVNNLVSLHTRTEYEDWPDEERKRHLFRLWLSVPDGWALPEPFFARYGADPATGRPQGINLPPGVVSNAPLEAGELLA